MKKIRERFGIVHVCVVGDRGMLTSARVKDDAVPAGLDYLTAFRAPKIKHLVEHEQIQLSLFEDTDLFEILHPDYENDHLVVCKNPFLPKSAPESASRSSLRPKESSRGSPPRSPASAVRFAPETRLPFVFKKVLNRFKVAKHFILESADDAFGFSRKEGEIAREASRTNPVAPAKCSSSRAQKDSHEQDRRPSGGPQLPEPPRRPRDHHRQPNQPDRLQLR